VNKMIHEPRNIKDRVAVGDDIFIIEELDGGRVRLIPDPTHVLEVGTPINKALLQPIEDALGEVTRKLSGIEEGAQVNTVTSVAGKTGAVTLTKSDVGLGNVQNYGIATQAQAQAGTANNVYMTPLRTTEAFNSRVVFARVDEVFSESGTVIRRASSPTDYNTIKFDTLLSAGSDTAWLGLSFPSLGDVVVGIPQYQLTQHSTPTLSLEFRPFQTLNWDIAVGNIAICHGIELFGPSRVTFLVTRWSGTGALNDIYLHFRFTGLKLA